MARVGTDGFVLLDALDGARAPADAAASPEVAVPRRVWARRFERVRDGRGGGEAGGGVRSRPVQGRGPGDRVESPCDIDARSRSKRGVGWTGCMAHFTETRDEGAPRSVVHSGTTPADVHETARTRPIHDALDAKTRRRLPGTG